MKRWDPVIDAKLKTEMCPGGTGHGPAPRFKSQCVLCRTLAHLEIPAEAAAAARAAVPAPTYQPPVEKTEKSKKKTKKKTL